MHESNICTKKDCCGTSRHCNNKCCDPHGPYKYLVVQVTEAIGANDN